MKLLIFIAAGAGLLVGGCEKAADGVLPASSAKGRYAGIGHYAPGPLWAQVTRSAPKNAAAARLDDDEQIIVVLDTHSGEVRQCGNLSGHCISLNPWSRSLGADQQAPLPLAKHASELDAEAAEPVGR
ncbi:MAG TPA: hypothetical protein VEB20_04240 [Azospirillaceae bacterium]|nr:hypothetical protein [Azospirillaceae bacterium]